MSSFSPTLNSYTITSIFIQNKLGLSKAVYIVVGAINTDIVKVIIFMDVQELPMLTSNQEEADTRLILHAIYLAKISALSYDSMTRT